MQIEVRDITVRITAGNRAELMAALAGRLRAGQGFSLVTLNLDHLVKLRSDAGFRAAYAGADFVTADGNPVVWLSRLAGAPLELVTGADLVLPLATEAAAAGVPIALIGSTDAALAQAAGALRLQVPGLDIAAMIAPPMGFDPEGTAAAAVLREAEAAGAGLAFLAFGAPRQEKLAALGRGVVPGMGLVCIGAGLDFLAGTQRRAPRWVRALALEWLWRLLSDPRRLAGRYTRSALVLPGHAIRALGQRRTRGG